jgi:AcrR family transcriptional regulator
MTATDPVQDPLVQRPKRADARRNYDKVIGAARTAFGEHGSQTSLEEIARRAEVGIGTLYRNFPNRQALLEAVYVEELDSVCRAAAALDGSDPWADFVDYIHGLVGYLATKQALAHELLEYVDRDASFFQGCRGMLFQAGEPLLARAQEAKVVRTDTDLAQVIQLIGGIAKIPGAAPETIEHLLRIALDGLRYCG